MALDSFAVQPLKGERTPHATFAGWLRHGVWSVVERWQATRDQLYNTFTTASGALDDLIAEYDAGTHPPHRRWRVDIRPHRNTFRLEPT